MTSRKRTSPAQRVPVYIYVGEETKAEFAFYAATHGLDETGLANLLIVREQQVERLANLDNAVLKASARTEKIIARISPDRRERLDVTADNLGYSMSEAGAILILFELHERWLEKAVDNL